MGDRRTQIGITAAAGLIVLTAGGAQSWAGQLHRENVRTVRDQIKIDRQNVRTVRPDLKTTRQDFKKARHDINTRIKSGEFGTLSRSERRAIRTEALSGVRDNRFIANRNYKNGQVFLKADKRLLGAMTGKPHTRPDGEWKKVAPMASKAARQDTKALLKLDKEVKKEWKALTKESRGDLKTARKSVRAELKGSDLSKSERKAYRTEALSAVRATHASNKLNLAREKSVLAVRKEQLKKEQGYRWVQKKESFMDTMMGMGKDMAMGKPPRPDQAMKVGKAAAGAAKKGHGF